MSDDWPVDADGKRIPRPVIYQLDTGRPGQGIILRSAEWHDRFLAFLYAHGIRKMHFIMGNSIHVRLHEDGTLWLYTWQAVEGRPRCEHCPSCIKQEKVITPLVASVLNVPAPGCYIKDGWLDRLQAFPDVSVPAATEAQRDWARDVDAFRTERLRR